MCANNVSLLITQSLPRRLKHITVRLRSMCTNELNPSKYTAKTVG